MYKLGFFAEDLNLCHLDRSICLMGYFKLGSICVYIVKVLYRGLPEQLSATTCYCASQVEKETRIGDPDVIILCLTLQMWIC
jgi:hypothetical protein